jgi:signal transduction histidine kinase
VLLILASSTIIMVVFPMIFRRNLLQPLEQVLTGVQKVNAGNLDTQVKVEVNDEIGVLAQQFNLMTNSLKNYSEHMENLVEQRTEELETSLETLKSTQAQLIQSEKMASLGELTAGIAHEIQNPLNFVNNFSEVNQELIAELNNELKDGNLQEAIAIAQDVNENELKIIYHGKRADAIVKGMLQHSRASIGKKEATDLNALADEYLRLSYHGLRAKDKSINATINTYLDEKIKNIHIVPQDIGRVLLNLFTNAFHSVSEKKKQLEETSMSGSYEPTVTLITKALPAHQDSVTGVEIRVRDNGLGIATSVLDKVFQPFFSTRRTGEGTGLGLSISYDIIKAHGGEIKIETTEGEFAEFIIYLPSSSSETNETKKNYQIYKPDV